MTRSLRAYAIAFVATLLAVAARWALMPMLGQTSPYLTVVPVLCVIALLYDEWVAVASAMLGVFATELLLVHPNSSQTPAVHVFTRLALLLLFVLAIGMLARRLRKAEESAVERARMAQLAERDARLSEERAVARANELQAVLDAVPAAVFVTRRPDASQIEGNRYCAEMLRIPPGSNASMSAPDHERPTEFRFTKDGEEVSPDQLPVQLAAAGAVVRGCELDLVYADGTVRNLLGNATPLRDARGTLRGAVGAFIDVTELKEVERHLRLIDRRKDDFLAMLSHELRNPLAAIGNSLHVLRRAVPGSEQAARALSVVDRQTAHLTRLVDQLLEGTRIVRGTIEVRRERLDLADQVRCAVDDVRAAFESAGVALDLRNRAEPVWIDADPTRISQIIGNLLSNAVRFTPRGGHVRAELAVNQGCAILTVRDDGTGIPKAALDSIFEPFVQESPGLARSKGGLGLGLAFVKLLVGLHGGTVHAESDGPGTGATFVVRIPRAPAPGREREQ